MSDDRVENKRLLMEMERAAREINREIINPAIDELHLDDLRPMLEMVARARAAYLKGLLDLSEKVGTGLPSSEQIQALRRLHVIYEELLDAAQAMQTAIERGYLDVRR